MGLGSLTDVLCQPDSTEVSDRGDYLKVLTKACPGYWNGNYIILKKAPKVTDLQYWDGIWQESFCNEPLVEKKIFSWEVTPEEELFLGANQRPSDNRFIDIERVYIFKKDYPPKPLKGLQFNKVSSESGWNQVREIGLEDIAPSDQARIDYWYWRVEQYKETVNHGGGEWWLASMDGTPVGSAGIMSNSVYARFQEVTTVEKWRNIGVASNLVYYMAKNVPRNNIETVIVAEADSQAERVYKRLGFKLHGYQVALLSDRD